MPPQRKKRRNTSNRSARPVLYLRAFGTGKELPAESKAAGTYWYRLTANGKRIRAKLLDPKTGTPPETLEAARALLEIIAAPVLAKSEVARIEQLADAYTRTETKLAAAVEAVRPRLALADAWKRYEQDTTRPDSGPRMLQDCGQLWGAFVSWMEDTHPKLLGMEAVTPDLAADYARSLGKLTANTFNKRIAAARLIFKTLAAACGNMANPFATVRTKQLAIMGHRELSGAELQAVMDAARGDLRTLFHIGLFTALRLGDAATLRWADINFRANMIIRAPNKTARRHPDKLVKIPLHSDLRAILEQCPLESRGEYVLPELAAMYLRDHTALSKRVQAHIIACGITTTERRPGRTRPVVLVGFHSLRHSFVSLCAEQGVPLAIVQELCGHSSPAIQRHYIHIGETATRSAIAALPSMARPLALPAGDTAATEAPDAIRAALLARMQRKVYDAPLDTIRAALAVLEGRT